MIEKACEVCKTSFHVSPSVIKKFCSRSCFFQSRRGLSSAMKGRHHTPETRAKIAQSLLGNKNFPTSYEVTCQSCYEKFDARTSNGKWCSICCPDKTFRSRLRLYNVSKPVWDKMLADQGGHCALCDKEPTVVDHDHVTNVVRGLLCYACNIALGRVDVSGWIEKAVEYASRGKN